MSARPEWYDDLNDAIEARIEETCSLYPRSERPEVVFAVARAIHRRANDTDPDCAWLSIMLESADAPGSVQGGDPGRITHDEHPSNGDAEDVAEDICRLSTPYGEASPTIAIRSGVHVAWTRFILDLDLHDRAALAADAVRYA